MRLLNRTYNIIIIFLLLLLRLWLWYLTRLKEWLLWFQFQLIILSCLHQLKSVLKFNLCLLTAGFIVGGNHLRLNHGIGILFVWWGQFFILVFYQLFAVFHAGEFWHYFCVYALFFHLFYLLKFFDILAFSDTFNIFEIGPSFSVIFINFSLGIIKSIPAGSNNLVDTFISQSMLVSTLKYDSQMTWEKYSSTH